MSDISESDSMRSETPPLDPFIAATYSDALLDVLLLRECGYDARSVRGIRRTVIKCCAGRAHAKLMRTWYSKHPNAPRP